MLRPGEPFGWFSLAEARESGHVVAAESSRVLQLLRSDVIEIARKSPAIGDRLLACEHNTVLATTDITAHAEVNALRSACHAARDIFLEGAIVATTCEPCPMCTAALHWARVRTVYFGATIDDAADAGFNDFLARLKKLRGKQ